VAACAIRSGRAFQIVSAFLAGSTTAVHIGFDAVLHLIIALRFSANVIDTIYVCYRQIAVSLYLAGLALRASFAATAAIHERFRAIFDAVGTRSRSASSVGTSYTILLAHA